MEQAKLPIIDDILLRCMNQDLHEYDNAILALHGALTTPCEFYSFEYGDINIDVPKNKALEIMYNHTAKLYDLFIVRYGFEPHTARYGNETSFTAIRDLYRTVT